VTVRFLLQTALREQFDEVLQTTLAAERAGFSAVLVPDHFFSRLRGTGADVVGLGESWATLAALAARTERIRLGGAVMCNPFRHPCLTAQIAATVDHISGGRLELGLGAGWMAEEFRRTGIPFPRAGERIDMLAEALEIVLPALEGREVSFRGAHYAVEQFSVSPKPVQTPRPPLHVGGGGDRLLRLAGRTADIVSVVPPAKYGDIQRDEVIAFTPERVVERIGFLRAAAEEAGRDPASIEVVSFGNVVNVTESAAQAAQIFQGMAKMFDTEPSVIRDHPAVIVGTPEEIRATLEERRARWGIDAVMVPFSTPAEVETFGKEIVAPLSA
jgi:probable F420-dependent oxidoreductase